MHSEMPEQENGLLEGFQFWVNLPAGHKLDPPRYQEHPASDIPLETRQGGIGLRVIAGVTSQGTTGPVVQPLTEPLYLDVRVPAGQQFVETLPASHNAFIYMVEGQTNVADEKGQLTRLVRDDLGVLGEGDTVKLDAGKSDVRFLLVAGKPLREPVARGGPFVMNTRSEVQQAFEDYEAGKF